MACHARDARSLELSTSTRLLAPARGESNDDAAAMERRGPVLPILPALATVLVLIAQPARAEDWEWVHTLTGDSWDDYAWSVAADAAGNSYVAGWFRGTGSFGTTTLTALHPTYYDIYVAKLDVSGAFEWVRSPGGYCPIPGAGSEFGAGVAVDATGNVYLSGTFTGTATFGGTTLVGSGTAGVVRDAFVAKLDPDGNYLWAVQGDCSTYHGFCQDVAVDSSGNVYVAGHFGTDITFGSVSLTAPLGNEYEMYAAKFDSSGNPLWAKRIGGGQNDKCYSIALDAAGNAYIAGWFAETLSWSGSASTLTSRGSHDAFVAKLSPSGVFEWVRQGGGTGDDRAAAIAADGSGNLTITGYYYDTADFGAHQLVASGLSSEFYVARLDSDGNFIWARTGWGGTDHGQAAAIDADGNCYIAGDTNGSITLGTFTLDESNTELFVTALDSAGNWLWAEAAIITGSWCDVHGIAVDPDGRIHLAGRCDDDITLGTASAIVPATYTAGFVALREPPVESQIVVADPGADFVAGATTSLTLEVHDGSGLMSGDNTTRITLAPTGSGTVSVVGTGTLIAGTLGVPGGAVTVEVSGGVVSVTLTDTVAEAFAVAVTNDSGHTDPTPDPSYTVSPAGPWRAEVTDPGADFLAGASTTLTVEVQDQYGNTITSDSLTEITLSPTGSGAIESVEIGTLVGGSLGAPGVAATVTVAGGVVSVTLTDAVVETFTVTITDNASLADPTPPSYTVGPAAPDEVVVTAAGADFAADASTTLSVAVHDTLGSPVSGDNTTQITFLPTGSGAVSAIGTGTLTAGTLGVPGGTVTIEVSGGVVSITLADTVAETFSVAITNNAGLTDPTPDPSYTVSPGAAFAVEVTDPGADFTAGASTTLSVEVQDQYGNTVTTDNTTEITFSPSGDGTIQTVAAGVLVAGSPGTPGAAVTVAVAEGVASVALTNSVAETFQVAVTSNPAITNPPPQSYTVSAIPGSDGGGCISGCGPINGRRTGGGAMLALLACMVLVWRRSCRSRAAVR